MIYIVIPVFNRWHFTKPCLDSLAKQTYRDFQVVVVDHGSTDETRESIIKDYPWVTLLLGNDTMWWTAAVNLGIKYVLEIGEINDLILTLNNDLEVNKNYLNYLQLLSKTVDKSIIGSLVLDINDHLSCCFMGCKWNKWTAKYQVRKGIYTESKLVGDFLFTDLLPGRGTLFPLALFSEFGIFDEVGFPHYAADEDFSLRCKNAGYNLIVSTKALVYSHVKDSGINKKNVKSINHFINYLFSIRSEANLKIRLRWAFKNTPCPPLYFLLDSFRLLISFFSK